MGILIHGTHRRLAELWMKKKNHTLTDKEETEIVHCLNWNMTTCWNMAKLENESYVAAETNDTEWQYEICAKVDKLLL